MKYIVVFGNNLGKPNALRTTNSRILCALSFYEPGDVIITSGCDTSGQGITEADYMANVLKSHGVTDVVVEPRARNTIENILYSYQLIKTDNILWVSSDYHVPRIRTILNEYNFLGDVVGATSKQIPNFC